MNLDNYAYMVVAPSASPWFCFVSAYATIGGGPQLALNCPISMLSVLDFLFARLLLPGRFSGCASLRGAGAAAAAAAAAATAAATAAAAALFATFLAAAPLSPL
jgi:hypothetical protein